MQSKHHTLNIPPLTSTSQHLWSLTQGTRLSLSAAVVLSLATSVMTIFQPRFLQGVVNEASTGSVDIQPLLGLIGLVICTSITTGLGSYFSGLGAENVALTLRERVTKKYLSMTIKENDAANSADLLARATADTLVVKQMIMGGFLPTLGSILMLFGIAAFMIMMDVLLFGVTVLVVALGFGLVMLVSRTANNASKEMQEATGEFSVSIERMLSSLRTIKAFNAQEMEQRNIWEQASVLKRTGITLTRISAFIQPALNLCIQSAIVVVILTGAVRLHEGTLDLGGLLAYLMYMFLLISPIASLGQAYTQIQIGLGALSRLRELENFAHEDDMESTLTTEVFDVSHTQSMIPHPSHSPKCVPLLNFRGVTFSYEPGAPTLKDVNLEIQAGQKVCIIGHSGSGKTTLLEIIERFYAPEAGSILLNGVDIKEINLNHYRSQFALVSQGCDVLTGTLRDNLTLGNNQYSEERLWEVLDMVGLRNLVGKDDFALDSDLGQDGVALSGGQRQRIAWARALLSEAQVLLLDEPTSSLDPETERMTHRLLENMNGKTIIMVTHQLDWVSEADEIIMLEEGRVIAQGSHQQLMDTSPAYQRLTTSHTVLAA